LISKVSLFIPELPGYGISSPVQDSSKRAVGGLLLGALQSVFHITASSPRKVILGGHDRGARVVHRLAAHRAEYAPALEVIGAVMIDILPTAVQYERFSDPVIAKGYFHWPLLSNAESATQLIKVYGGAKWCREVHKRMAGPISFAIVQKDGAIDLHAELFDKEETLRGSADDYEAGAIKDVPEQLEDQKQGKKIDVPTLVIFSERGIGARTDAAAVWKDWVKDRTSYSSIAVGDGIGHFIPEEAPELVSMKILDFLKLAK
jgi:pimeloyl-ACP methyl ester carboxylesterase